MNPGWNADKNHCFSIGVLSKDCGFESYLGSQMKSLDLAVYD
jgi:hypothetical protein